jgi:hypothetical protein
MGRNDARRGSLGATGALASTAALAAGSGLDDMGPELPLERQRLARLGELPLLRLVELLLQLGDLALGLREGSLLRHQL